MRGTHRRLGVALAALAGAACQAGGGAGKGAPVPAAKGECTAMPSDVYRHAQHESRVVVTDTGDGLRRYELSSTAPLRDGLPEGGRRTVVEAPGQMRLRSGHDLFDALFAQAMVEVREASVSQIRDAAFDGGAPAPCECFETGEKWTYVWTRDTAYAVDLALALVDPGRARRSLEFKLSARNGGGGAQIVQDTGSGGSWPISTDRVVWALGARAVLAQLRGAEREAFRDRVYAALVETAEQDRQYVYDAATGLYRGEQSFLDWREQSYPSYTAEDTTAIASSRALSTNVAHLALLELAAELAAETGQGDARDRYRSWADALRAAIHRELWLPDEGLYATFALGAVDPVPVRRFDLLGSSLAVLHGVAPADAARSAVTRYPRSAIGAPVVWPQVATVAIYHNRGMWPFVSAYSLLAARRVGSAAVFDHDLESLVRGAALNLSNMENFDFATGAAFTEEGERSGPVVNSRRQLWSVAGYIAAVVRGVFGVEADAGGLSVSPFVTRAVRRRYFGAQDRVTLFDVPVGDARVDVELLLPPCAGGDGVLQVEAVLLDGEPIEGRIPRSRLGADSVVSVRLGPGEAASGALRVVDTGGDPRLFYSPREVRLTEVSADGDDLVLSIDAAGQTDVVIDVFRDGTLVAEGIAGSSWRDAGAARPASATHCYAAAARDPDTGTRSHLSAPLCHAGEGALTEIAAADLEHRGGRLTSGHGRAHLAGWGAPEDTITATFTPERSGRHLVRAVYANGHGPVNTGITAGVKRLTIVGAAGNEVASGTLIMPHRGDWSVWAESTPVAAELEAGQRYELRIADGMNMSYFDHFRRYGGAGGGAAPVNTVNLAALRIVRH